MTAEAYVDTSALIAFADRSDSHHELFSALFADPPQLVTTPLVLAEGHGWFLRRYDRQRASRFLEFVDALSPLVVVPLGIDEYRGGRTALSRFADQDLTLADAVGLHLMSARRISECWSTDRHLGLGGAALAIDR